MHVCVTSVKLLFRRVYTDDKCLGKGTAVSAALHAHLLLTNGAVVEEDGDFHARADPGMGKMCNNNKKK